MAASALIKFSQGVNVADGMALKGVTGTAVSVENSDNTGVASWQIDLVYVDPQSSIVPATPFAFNNSSSVPLATFTPDVKGSYRFVLSVWDVPFRVGPATSVDIRVFTVPESGGLVVPPAQLWPEPLPVPQSGRPNARPNEFNFGGQPDGWAGDGSSDGLLNDFIRRVDKALVTTAVQEVLPVSSNGQTSFTLSQATTSNVSVEMYVNGLKQTQGVDYTVDGANLTYAGSVAILLIDTVEVWYVVGAIAGQNSARQETITVTSNGQTSFTLSQATTSSGTVEMFVNSAKMQQGVDYAVVGDQVTYTGSIPLQTTDVVEFWYLIGPITSSEVNSLIKEPDVASYSDVLRVLGIHHPVSVRLAGPYLWVINKRDATAGIPSALVRMPLATLRPDLVLEAPDTNVWLDIAFASTTAAVILCDNAGGTTRMIQEVSLTSYTPTLGGLDTIGTPTEDPGTTGYHREGQVVWTGTHYWALAQEGAIRIAPGSLAGPYDTVSPSAGGNPHALCYDPDTANYTDATPRVWLLSDSVTSDGNEMLDRIELIGLTIDASLPISLSAPSSTSYAASVFAGGGVIWVMDFVNSSTPTIRSIGPQSVTQINSAVLTDLAQPHAGVYDTASSKVVATGVGFYSTFVASRVNASTLATELSYTFPLDSSLDQVRPGVFLNRVWIPGFGSDVIHKADIAAHTYADTHKHYLEYRALDIASPPPFGIRYVDGHAASANPNGSQSAPFSTIAAALASLSGPELASSNGYAIYLAPALYNEAIAPTGTRAAFIGMTSWSSSFTTPGVTFTGNIDYSGLTVALVLQQIFGGSLALNINGSSTIDIFIQDCAGLNTVSSTGGKVLLSGKAPLLSNTDTFAGSTVSSITGADTVKVLNAAVGQLYCVTAFLKSARVSVNLGLTGDLIAEDTTFTNGLTDFYAVNMTFDNCVTGFTAVPSGTVLASNTDFQHGSPFNSSGTLIRAYDCQFASGGVTVTFSGSPGVLQVDAVSNYWFKNAATPSIVNGSKVIIGDLTP